MLSQSDLPRGDERRQLFRRRLLKRLVEQDVIAESFRHLHHKPGECSENTAEHPRARGRYGVTAWAMEGLHE